MQPYVTKLVQEVRETYPGVVQVKTEVEWSDGVSQESSGVPLGCVSPELLRLDRALFGAPDLDAALAEYNVELDRLKALPGALPAHREVNHG